MTPHEGSLILRSTHRAGDAAWLAVADVVEVAERLDVVYRLVGGNSVALLVNHHGVADVVPPRETADADVGVPFEVCGDVRLLPALTGAGYERTAGNRFERSVGDRRLVIDILAPSYTGTLLSNQPHGELVVDEIPGLLDALHLPATRVHAEVVLTDGAAMTIDVALPDVRAALIMKAYSYAGRLSANDAVDVWRLLEAANAEGLTADDWPATAGGGDAAVLLHQHFASPAGAGPRRGTSDRGVHARIRALTHRVVPSPAG
jgi:hypothetical protein